MKDYIGCSILANYFRGIEAVGGKITFDEDGFTFKSHKLNIQTGETKIEYSQIKKITTSNTLGIVPNGMSIITKDDVKHKFVINNRKKVIEFISSKL